MRFKHGGGEQPCREPAPHPRFSFLGICPLLGNGMQHETVCEKSGSSSKAGWATTHGSKHDEQAWASSGGRLTVA